MRGRRRTPTRDPVRLLDERDAHSHRMRSLRHCDEILRLDAAAGAVAEDERGPWFVRATHVRVRHAERRVDLEQLHRRGTLRRLTRATRLTLPALAVLTFVLASVGTASAYSWPVKPFHKPHPIRGTFGDPRFHLDAEGELSAFHFGVDIVARDGAPVYAVEPGVVVRRHATRSRSAVPSGRRFGYWHVRPVVKAGRTFACTS